MSHLTFNWFPMHEQQLPHSCANKTNANPKRNYGIVYLCCRTLTKTTLMPQIKYVIIALLLFTTSTVFGQLNLNDSNELSKLSGKWKFHELHEKEKMDSAGIKMLLMFFGSMSLQFDQDGLYKAFMMGKDEQGNWAIKDKETITLSSDKGRSNEITVLDLTNERLTFKLRRSAFVMEKVTESNHEKLVQTTAKLPAVTASKEAICKKWYLKKKETAKKHSEEITEAAQDLLSGTYLKFQENGKYQMMILKMKEKGKWNFGQEKKSIVTSKKDSKQVWNIISISDTELVLVQGLSEEKWIFNSEK